MTKHAQPVVPIIPHSLKAVLNEQVGPGHPHSFTASVDVEVEVDWKVELVSAKPQGINPLVKLLAFHVELPHGTAHSKRHRQAHAPLRGEAAAREIFERDAGRRQGDGVREGRDRRLSLRTRGDIRWRMPPRRAAQ